MADFPTLPKVAEFYAGKNIFLTGATGFVGKALMEKVLRSCPDIKGIYILMRPKKKQDVSQRLEKMSKCQIFDWLRKQQPKFHEKIIPIKGDINLPDLGISPSDLELLRNNIHIVIHSAATVKFDEPLRVAVNVNVLAVRKMIKLARQLKYLEVFVHVSTAYAYSDRTTVGETVYDPPVEPQKLIEALEWMDDDIIEKITPRLIGGKPNTYTYSKHIAECLLLEEGHDLPLAIIRPSIIGAAWSEPTPGFIDFLNAPALLYLCIGQGMVRCVPAKHDVLADFVPLDTCVNMIIAVGWYTAVWKPNSCLIYNCTTSAKNPLEVGTLLQYMKEAWHETPLDRCMRRPCKPATCVGPYYDLYYSVCHNLPAYLIDIGKRMTGRKPKVVNMYNRIYRVFDQVQFTAQKNWDWAYNNVDMLNSKLDAEDRKIFCCDPKAFAWSTYVRDFCRGIKKYILKQDTTNVTAAKEHLNKLRNISYGCTTVLLVMMYPVLSTVLGYVAPFNFTK